MASVPKKESGLKTILKTSAASQNHEAASNGVVYISPRELVVRWRCSRSTVDRIAVRARLTRLCLGDGRNGIIRYLIKEVEQYEQSRMLRQ